MERVFVYDPAGNPSFHVWKLPAVINSFGPHHTLTELLKDFRNFVRSKQAEFKRQIDYISQLSDDGVDKLLKLAYRASFHTDEGRAIRVRIAVRKDWKLAKLPPNPEDIPEVFAQWAPVQAILQKMALETAEAMEEYKLFRFQFDMPLPLDDPKLIVKLAPVLGEEGDAITVEELTNGLAVTGLASLDCEERSWELFGMPLNPRPRAGLTIEILGPGHLRVQEGSAEFTLAADRLVNHTELLHQPLIRDWLGEWSHNLADKMKKRPDYTENAQLFELMDMGTDGKPEPHLHILVMFARLIRYAQRLGHGGAFAFVPDLAKAPINITYKMEPIDLGEHLINVWVSECHIHRASRSDISEFQTAAVRKRNAVESWVRLIPQISQMCAADGCVTLTRGLVLVGFGGIIEMPDKPTRSRKRFDNITSGQPMNPEEMFKKMGTRHKSAYALCNAVDGAIVIVLSQDGDLRLFASDEYTVYFADSLRP